ncbi:MAG: hypothetical protein M0C28_32895 [Candidatus Moduliflexus flocculans]|nr:hypothetical protein [Candidatus Moduliflexus flocculans]
MSRGELNAVPIRSIRHVRDDQPAYNLLVMPGGTFIPAEIVVHNKGCFLPGEPDPAGGRQRKADQRHPAGGSCAGLFAGGEDRPDPGAECPSPYGG